MRTPADLGALAALLALLAAPAAAQAPARPVSAAPAAAGAALPAADVYRREVFRYQRGGRPDPFQPLLTAAELGFRVEDLRLTAIIYSPGGNRSVAVFATGDSARRYRLRQGQRMGTMTVLRILPQRVDVRVDEFGGSHLQSIPLVRTERIQQQAAQAAGAQGQPQIPVTIAPAPQAPQPPRVLRRGAVPAAQAAGAPPPAAPAPPPAPPVNPRSPSYTTGTRPR